jgi:hypothetical protein
MSVNSDEIADGILKAVGQLAVIAGIVYCIYSYPWLLLLLIPIALVLIAWATWSARKLGRLLIWSGLITWLAGGCAYYLGRTDWLGLSILGGLVCVAIGAAVKDQAERRGATTRSIPEERQEVDDLNPEEREQRKRETLQRVQDAMARILKNSAPKE